MSDLQTFALAFAIVWIGLGSYLVWLHVLARRIEAMSLRRTRP